MAKLANDQAAALIQQIVHDYIGTQSWFYQQQIDPYLPAVSMQILSELAKKGISLVTAEPKKAPKDAKPSS